MKRIASTLLIGCGVASASCTSDLESESAGAVAPTTDETEPTGESVTVADSGLTTTAPVGSEAAVGDAGIPGSPESSPGEPVDGPVAETPVPTGVVGTVCEEDADCAGGTVCMTNDSGALLGGGPANGYCSVECSAGADTCETIDSSSFCVQQGGGAAICMAECDTGEPEPGTTKCHDRADLACTGLGSTAFCRPTCRNDADCGDRFCDLSSGVCRAEASVGDQPLGAPCTDGTECASQFCFALSETTGFCSGLCNIATVQTESQDSCGNVGDPKQPGEGVCLLLAFEGAGLGDLAYCGQRCNCDDDCGAPDLVCDHLSESAQASLGTVGICNQAVSPDPTQPVREGIACAGGADAGTPNGGDAGTAPDISTAPDIGTSPYIYIGAESDAGSDAG